MDEHWLPVPGYEGLYDVSDLGNVRSHHKSKRPRKSGSLLLTPGLGTGGHVTVVLYRDKKRRSWPVHQLVLLAFVGPRPGRTYGRGASEMETLHGRGGKHDNRL